MNPTKPTPQELRKAASRARLAAVPTNQLNLRTAGAWREFKRRMAREARNSRHGWQRSQPAVGMRFAGSPQRVKLANKIGERQRWRWVAKGA